MTSPVERVIAALEVRGCQPKENSDGYEARCPSHDDHDPSLSVSEGDGGRALVHCFAGCTIEEVVEALGLSMLDLMTENGDPATRPKSKPHWLFIPAPNSAPPPEPHTTLGKTTYRWAYLDAEGLLLGYVCRWDTPGENGDKEIRPLTFGRMSDEDPGCERWEWRSWPAPAPLYGLHAVEQNPTAVVLVTEGEKAADAASELFPDFVAVTSHGGSNRAHNADWSPLKGRRVVVWPDQDAAGRKYGAEVARLALKAGAESVAVVNVPQDWPEGWDVADNPPEGVTTEDLRMMISNGVPVKVGAEEIPVGNADPLVPLNRLSEIPTLPEVTAALMAFASVVKGQSNLDAAISRVGAIQILKEKTVGSPARLVDAAIEDAAPKTTAATSDTMLVDIDPWEDPVDGIEVFELVRSTFTRFIVLFDHADVVLTLWVMHAHAHSASMISPILCVNSAEKGSGKTTLLDVIGALVPRVLSVANTTVAAVFRAIEAFAPTLLIDEADSFFRDNDELRGILNAGHRRGGSVLRVVGDDHTPKQFSVWSPKAIALIGNLPGTLEDRSVIVNMRRASADEFQEIDRFRLDRHPEELRPVSRKAARWVVDHRKELNMSDPVMPQCLYGRAADNWRPLLAIAEAVGGEWPGFAREAAVAIAGRSENESNGVLLLEDLRRLFDRTEAGGRLIERWPSSQLVEELVKLEARPWPEFSRGRPLTVRQLARLLRPFEIQPKKFRFGDSTAQGYERDQFADAWNRYLKDSNIESPGTPPVPSRTPEQCNGDVHSREIRTGTFKTYVPDRNSLELNDDGQCSGVLDEKWGVRAGIDDDELVEEVI